MRTFEEIWYRGGAALRIGAKVYRGEWGVWLEMANAFAGRERSIPAAGGAKYDWPNKLAFKLRREDLGRLGWAFSLQKVGELLTLVHRYQGKNKTLKIVLVQNGNYFINGFGQQSKISISLSEEAIWRFRHCLRLAYEDSICKEKEYAEPLR